MPFLNKKWEQGITASQICAKEAGWFIQLLVTDLWDVCIQAVTTTYYQILSTNSLGSYSGIPFSVNKYSWLWCLDHCTVGMGWLLGWEGASSSLQSMLMLHVSCLEKVVGKPTRSVPEPGTQAHFHGVGGCTTSGWCFEIQREQMIPLLKKAKPDHFDG